MITYNVSRSTISTWIKDKNHILNYTGPETQQRDQPIKHVELENKLYDLYRGAIALYPVTKIPINESLLLVKANQLSNEKVHISFIQRFMERKQLVSTNLHGEGGSCPLSNNLDTLRYYIDQYSPDDIFNMDETSFFYEKVSQRMVIKKNVSQPV